MEVLIASCIIGISLSVILSGFATNMKDAQVAEKYSSALEIARTKMLSCMLLKKQKPLKAGGKQGEYDWKLLMKKAKNRKDWQVSVECSFYQGSERRTVNIETLINNFEGSG